MCKVVLVSGQENNDVGISVIPELSEPLTSGIERVCTMSEIQMSIQLANNSPRLVISYTNKAPTAPR
jgi:hypothetical protein